MLHLNLPLLCLFDDELADCGSFASVQSFAGKRLLTLLFGARIKLLCQECQKEAESK